MSFRALPVRASVPATAVLLFLACLATASRVPLFDPDEGYYPATARESLDAGSGWDPRLDGAPRWDKPILSYLLIEAAFSLTGTSAMAARVPSALEGAACVVIAGLVTSSIAGPVAGALAAVVLASTLGVQVFARAAHPEIAVVLSIFTTELLCVLWLLDDGRRRARLAAAAGLAMAYGILAKGPVAVVLPTLAAVATVAILRLRVNWRLALLHSAGAIAGGVLLAAPWYALMTAQHGWPFLQESLWRHNVMRYVTGEFGHRGALWFFLVPTAVAMLPWTPFLGRGVQYALRQPRTARTTLAVFMLASAGTALIFYSMSRSKLPNYALVIVPPLAIVVALTLAVEISGGRRSTASTVLAGAALFVLGLAFIVVPFAIAHGTNARVLLGGAPSRSPNVAGALWWVVLPPAAVCIAAPVIVWRASRVVTRVSALAVAGFLLPLLLLTTAGPLLREVYPWQQFGSVLAGRPGTLWLYRYRAPSLTFYARRPVQQIADQDALKTILARGDGWLVLDDRAWESIATDTARATVVDQHGRMRLLRLGDAGGRMQ